MKKQTLLKLASALLALASVPFLWVYGAYRWAVWRVDHPAPGEVSSISVITGEKEHSGVAIIGGADGPTALYLTSKLAPDLLGAIAIAAYSYMALVPVIQPPIIKLLTTPEERVIKMEQLREVSKTEKIIFPIVVTLFTVLLLPSAGALIGMLMLGNLLKESGRVPLLVD